MDIRDIRVLHGLNMWTYRSALEAIVDLGALKDAASNELPGFNARLMAWLPSLVEHRCSIGERGGFCQRLTRGTYQAHILEHVCLELQSLLGYPIGFGRARETDEEGVYKVIVGFQDEQVAIACLYRAKELLQAAVEDFPYDIQAVLEELKEYARQVGLTDSERALIAAAKQRNIPCGRVEHSHLLYFGQGKKQKHSWCALTDDTGSIAYNIVDNRELLPQLLRSAGLPVPEGHLLSDRGEAWSDAENLGLPVVIKRRYAAYAQGAQLNLCTQAAVEHAYDLAKDDGYSLIIEQFVSGSTYHLLMIHGQLVAASCENSSGITHVKSLVHPENIHYAALAAKIVGLKIAHIVMVAEDIQKSLRKQQGKIVAMNAELNLLYWQDAGSDQNLAATALMADFFPEAQDNPGRIPIFSVSGLKGQNLAARLLHHIFLQQKQDVGLACQQGIWLKQRLINPARSDQAKAAMQLLGNPWIDCAILENSWQGIQAMGLGFERCAYAVITDVAALDLPEDPDQQEYIFKNIRSVVDGVKTSGVAILPAEDLLTPALAKLCGGQVCYFSLTGEQPVLQAHAAAQGANVYLKGHFIILAQGQEKVAALSVEILSQLDEHAQKSLLAAVSAAWLSGSHAEGIAQALNSFRDWFVQEPQSL